MTESKTANPDTPQTDAILLRGTNQSGMRARNERLVLSIIRQHGPMAKADIARATGLSAQTVSVIMRALESDGLLVKGDPVRGRVGQPSVPMALAPDGAYFLGLKVGRRSVELVLIDFHGRVVDRARQTYVYPTPEAALDFARSHVAQMLGRQPRARRDRIAGLGIAMPFFLWNWARELGVPEESMSGWRDADLRAEIAAAFDFPVLLQNDATAACGAQVVFGPADQPRDFLYFYVGYFIGGGVVLNGRLFTGRGNAGALGPMPVATDQGVQSLIDVASLSRLEARLSERGHAAAQMWTGTEGWDLDAAILADWTGAAAHGLAHAIVSASALIDFEAVIIDGWIPPDLRAALVTQTAAHLDSFDLTGLILPEIREGTIGPDARAIGAASLPLSERFMVDANAFQAAP